MLLAYFIFAITCVIGIFRVFKYKVDSKTLVYVYLTMFQYAALVTIDVTTIEFCIEMQMSSALVAIMIYSQRKKPQIEANKIFEDKYSNILKNARLIYATIIIASIYHFSVVGFPIFSDNIDQIRFEQAKSGLFGLPSRLAVYGPIVILWFSLLGDKFNMRSNERILLIIAGIVLLMVSGNKSSLWAVVICITFSWTITTRTTKNLINKLFPFFIVLVISYIIFIFNKLESLSGYSSSFSAYFLDRLTYIAIQPVYEAYNWKDPTTDKLASNIILNDIIYPVSKILDQNSDIFITKLSRSIYGIDSGEFSVPVTPGFFSYHVAAVGNILSYLMVLSFSVLYNKISNIVSSSKKPTNVLISLVVLYGLYTGYSTGNIYYALSNLIPLIFLIKISFLRFVK